MKIVKPKGQENWFVRFKTESGELREVNTGCQSKELALQMVKDAKVEELESAARAHRLTAEVVTLITANREVRVCDVLREWDEWMASGVMAPKTRQNNFIVVRRWMDDMGIESRSIGSIKSEEIHDWVNSKDDQSKMGTRIHKLSGIRNMFAYCLAKRYVLSDPSKLAFVDHRLLSHKQKEEEHKRVFRDDEFEYLLIKARAYEQPPSISDGFIVNALILGRDLGLRLSDICNLEWDCFNFSTQTVTVWARKTHARVELPMSQRVVNLVVNMREANKKFLFPKEREIINSVSRRSWLSIVFNRFFESCGFKGYSFHSVRATSATAMANKGASMEEIAKAMGHSTTQPTAAYVRKPDAAKVNIR